MVFYFTGTGNSLYVAKQIACWEGNSRGTRCQEPVSIPQVFREAKDGKAGTFAGDRIGIVTPVYGHEVPAMVKDFLKQAVFQTDYFYMILTYGNRHGGAAKLAERLCGECGIKPAYINTIQMVDNWLPGFDMEEQKKNDKHVEEQIAAVLGDLKLRRRWISPVTEEDLAAHQQFLDRMSQMPGDAWQHLLRITDACVGCGICEKVCPSDSIHVREGRAVHTAGNCQTCLACAHACPRKAIGLTVPEKNPQARYRNEHISLPELMKANGRAETAW